jgi:hypothetical protein
MSANALSGAWAQGSDEIRVGLKYGVDCFEHTGLATEPGYPEDILAAIRKRNNTLYWCPTVELAGGSASSP